MPSLQVLYCPRPSSFERHLRANPHRLLGAELKASVELLLSHRLKTASELKKTKPKSKTVSGN